MEEAEYRDKIAEINRNAAKLKIEVGREFALSNARFAVGDIITDGVWIIEVKSIHANISIGLPIPVYRGLSLKKDLTPRKDMSREVIYGNGNIELIKKK